MTRFNVGNHYLREEDYQDAYPIPQAQKEEVIASLIHQMNGSPKKEESPPVV